MPPKKIAKPRETGSNTDQEDEGLVEVPLNSLDLQYVRQQATPRPDNNVNEEDGELTKAFEQAKFLSDHGFRVEGEFKEGKLAFHFANGPRRSEPAPITSGRDSRRRPGIMQMFMPPAAPPRYSRREAARLLTEN
jgi:hypothetical protein